MKKEKKKQKQKIMYVDCEVDVAKGVYLIGYKKEHMGGIRIINATDARDQRDLSILEKDLQDPALIKITLSKDFLMFYLDYFFELEAEREQFKDLRDYATKLGMLKKDTETVQTLANKLKIDQSHIPTIPRWHLESKIKTEMLIFRKLNELYKEMYTICKSKM